MSPILEAKLVEWIENHDPLEPKPNRNTIRTKARSLKKELIKQGNEELRKFKISKGWLDKFCKRHGLG